METQFEARLLTVVLPKGKAMDLMNALNDKGVTRISFAFARGYEPIESAGRETPPDKEKELVYVVAKDPTQADELFTFIYEQAQLDEPGGGLIYMTRLNQATAFTLPELSEHQGSAEL